MKKMIKKMINIILMFFSSVVIFLIYGMFGLVVNSDPTKWNLKVLWLAILGSVLCWYIIKTMLDVFCFNFDKLMEK